MKTRTQEIAIAAMFAAIECVATMVIIIPSPLKGYLNLGDCIVLLAGWTLSPVYGFVAAGIGAALADVFSGYIIYAPATFLIKGVMAVTAFYGFRFLRGKTGDTLSRITSAIFSEIIMVLGYLLFEGVIYGFSSSVINVPANAMQGLVGIILSVILVKFFKNFSFFGKNE